MPLDPSIEEEFEKWGKTPPSSIGHGTDEDIRSKMVRLQPEEWHLHGNELSGMTEMGKIVSYIPTDHILVGTDDDGLPIFRKIA